MILSATLVTGCITYMRPSVAQTSAAKTTSPVILIVGDSLSAEYGLVRGTGWVPLLQKSLQTHPKRYAVVNASISGDTSAGGRARLPQLLTQHKPKVVVIELGANDALRGLELTQLKDNLTMMVKASKTAGAKVVLVGMQMPPNFGAAYSQSFSDTFAQVAKAEKASLVPSFLKGVADRSDALTLFQDDRIHPNAKAQPTMLQNVWVQLKPIL